MSDRLNQLKNLYDEAQALLDGGVDADTAYDRLSSRLSFNEITRDDVNYVYKKLQKKAVLDAKHKSFDADRKRHSTDLQKVYSEQKRFKLEMKSAENESQILSVEKERYATEYIKLKPYRQNAQKYLICEDIHLSSKDNDVKFWNDRFVLEDLKQTNRRRSFDNKKMNFIDLLHQKSTSISIPCSERSMISFYSLTGSYALMVESVYYRTNSYVLRLLKFDPDNASMCAIQSIQRDGQLEIFMDSENPSCFVLREARANEEEFSAELCILLDNQIEIGEEVEWIASGKMVSYSDYKLISIDWNFNFDEPRMTFQVYDLDLKDQDFLDAEAFPENVKVHGNDSTDSFVWLRDHCFISVKFSSSENYGVAFTSLKTLNWTILEFASYLPIRSLRFVNGSDLMIYAKGAHSTNDSNKSEQKAYKIPMCKPNKLRWIGWFKVIELYKKKQVRDPQRKARLRLPAESDLHSFRNIQ